MGLEIFKSHFAPYADCYVLIGGTACMLVREEVGLDFRATKDLDIVLSIEALNKNFAKSFWDFVKNGKYKFRQQSTGKKLFYRFHTPGHPDYPKMLELFSRKPDAIALTKNSELTPIPIDEEISSLSAILLDEEYYPFIHAGKRTIDGLPILSPEHLIPLKARAYLNLSAQLNKGKHVDRKNVRKHKKDIVLLYQLLTRNTRVHAPDPIKHDMCQFLIDFKEHPVDLKALGLKHTQLEDVIADLNHIYNLNEAT